MIDGLTVRQIATRRRCQLALNSSRRFYLLRLCLRLMRAGSWGSPFPADQLKMLSTRSRATPHRPHDRAHHFHVAQTIHPLRAQTPLAHTKANVSSTIQPVFASSLHPLSSYLLRLSLITRSLLGPLLPQTVSSDTLDDASVKGRPQAKRAAMAPLQAPKPGRDDIASTRDSSCGELRNAKQPSGFDTSAKSRHTPRAHQLAA